MHISTFFLFVDLFSIFSLKTLSFLAHNCIVGSSDHTIGDPWKQLFTLQVQAHIMQEQMGHHLIHSISSNKFLSEKKKKKEVLERKIFSSLVVFFWGGRRLV